MKPNQIQKIDHATGPSFRTAAGIGGVALGLVAAGVNILSAKSAQRAAAAVVDDAVAVNA